MFENKRMQEEEGAGAPSPAVVAALIENHRRFLGFLQKRVGNPADAEEILQAAFVKGLARAGEIRDEDRAVAWFYRLLRNAVIDHWRERAAENRAAEALARELKDEAPPPELEAEICRCFEALMPALKPDQARMLRRVDWRAGGPSTWRPRRASRPTRPWSASTAPAVPCANSSSVRAVHVRPTAAWTARAAHPADALAADANGAEV